MKKDMVFLSTEGITETKANQIADYAKLAYAEDEEMLSSLSFVDEKVETINGEKAKQLSYGRTSLDGIEEALEKIGRLKGLCAWLREAVKAHQNVIRETSAISFDEYVKMNGIELPVAPRLESVITEDDVIATFDIKKRNRYYYLDAVVKALGMCIHKGYPYDKARKRLFDKIHNPCSTIGNGTETLIYTYTPSISKEAVDELFYKLQQKQNSYQSELNAIKHEIQSRIMNDEVDKRKKFNDEYNAVEKYKNEYTLWLSEELKRVYALKIVIPNALKEVYEEVAAYGSQNKMK